MYNPSLACAHQTVRRGGAIPVWQEIERILFQEIIAGTFPRGKMFPTELELAVRFNVHRNTVRHALKGLKERGLIRAEPGRGTFVEEDALSYRLTSKSTLSSEASRYNRDRSRRYLGSARVAADALAARSLLVARSIFLQRIDMLEIVDGQAICISRNYFPLPRFTGIERIIEEKGSITAALDTFGVSQYSRFETRFSAGAASDDDAKLLGILRHQPILVITNVNLDADGAPIHLTRAHWSGSWVEMIVHFGH